MKDEIFELLRSAKPSERSLAIDLLHGSPIEVDLAVVRACMQSEPVPSLRSRLEGLLRSHEQRHPSTGRNPAQADVGELTDGSLEHNDENLIHWMRHELEPAIGWLRLAANSEIANFLESETCLAIEGLRKRIDSIEALGRASAPPRFELVPLGELLSDCLGASSVSAARAHLDLSSTGDGDIETDLRLFRLMMSNAIRNAFEALLELDDQELAVQISAGTTVSHFWINVSNRFAGAEFRMDEVSGSGVSGKIDHQGQGFNIMRMCATRLGYDLVLFADGGMATLTVRGRRRV